MDSPVREPMRLRAWFVSVLFTLVLFACFDQGMVTGQTIAGPPAAIVDFQSSDPVRRANAFWKWKESPAVLEPRR